MSESWLEVSLVVDGEMAESVAEVLARYIPDGGVVIESTAVTANLDDSEGQAVGPLRVYGYLPVNAQLEETRQRLEEGLWYLGRIRPLPEAQFRTIQQTNWAEAWKQHYRPIAIGRRLVIVPAWLESPAPKRIPIKIDPGMAFGTGTHPTTQLCLEMLERAADQLAPGWDAIDVGCGTAILSIGALKLGAGHALGVDIDAEAITASQENAAANGVLANLELGLGSLDEVRQGRFSIRQAPVVLANILAVVLVRMLDAGLGDLLAPGGALVLSGILAEQSADVETAGARNGLRLVDKRQIGDWVALHLARA
ncbi:MAG: 50S ribosomal protein L11 methyltransferase [Chloroflexota bacterium]